MLGVKHGRAIGPVRIIKSNSLSRVHSLDEINRDVVAIDVRRVLTSIKGLFSFTATKYRHISFNFLLQSRKDLTIFRGRLIMFI